MKEDREIRVIHACKLIIKARYYFAADNCGQACR